VKGPQNFLSADYQTGYQLVEFNSGGQELVRWGIQPLLPDLPASAPRTPPGRQPTHEHFGTFGNYSAMLPKNSTTYSYDLADIYDRLELLFSLTADPHHDDILAIVNYIAESWPARGGSGIST
jgi:hypothetical protein